MKNQMVINGRLERIDNNNVLSDLQGYYIQKNIGLWEEKIKKIYLTDKEIEEYISILDYNNQKELKNKQIESAIKNGRVVKVEQKITDKRAKIGVVYNAYYNEGGSIID